MKKIRVGLKYCGQCNPIVDGPSIIADFATEHCLILFVPWDDNNKDVLLVVDGCHRACATRPDFAGPVVVVSGRSLNGRLLSEVDLSPGIIKKIMEVAVDH